MKNVTSYKTCENCCREVPISRFISDPSTVKCPFCGFLEITQEEIDDGASRPENVVGSYAVYHQTRGRVNDSAGMEYKTGKAFHIYRPEAIDRDGNKVWCDLSISEQTGTLTVTVPQPFLDTAMYPVRVDPTFGYTTAGSSSGFEQDDILYGSGLYSMPEDGTLDSMSYYRAAADTATDAWLMAVYDSSDDSLVGSIQAGDDHAQGS